MENFGCRATQADGAAIERQLLEKGLSRAIEAHDAEVVVLNTCTVTASADQDARATIRRIHRDNPNARILVTGCYAQRAPQEIAALPGVSLVVGNSHKHQLADIATHNGGFVPLASVTANPQSSHVVVGDIFAHTELLAAPVFDADTASEKTRPNLKVQDGCNNRCSFCIIPFVRGKSRSLRPDEIIREVNSLVANGYREIVLSGINLGRWGRDLGTALPNSAEQGLSRLVEQGFSPAFQPTYRLEASASEVRRPRFVDLLRAILDHTSIEKLRISSVEPMDWSNDLIELAAFSPRVCKHAHVPLQSGSDRILRKMHRRYRPWHYADRIARIRDAMPTAAIGADVMVGFPGETDEDFEQTRSFIESLPFTYLHVFTYSSRPGTPSSEMAEQVPVQIARERNRILRELAAAKKRAFQEQFIGSELQAITLTNRHSGRTEALTDNFQKLWLDGIHEPNQLITARFTNIEGDALTGEAS